MMVIRKAITRIVVIIHRGMDTPIALTDEEGKTALAELLERHKGALVIYDGPPNQENILGKS